MSRPTSNRVRVRVIDYQAEHDLTYRWLTFNLWRRMLGREGR